MKCINFLTIKDHIRIFMDTVDLYVNRQPYNATFNNNSVVSILAMLNAVQHMVIVWGNGGQPINMINICEFCFLYIMRCRNNLFVWIRA